MTLAVASAAAGTAGVDVCAIDFGTSNSAVALPSGADPAAPIELVPLEDGSTTLPTAVFYFAEGPETDGPPRAFGRAAVQAYVNGSDGRLMRSLKSILGSALAEQRTDVGGGRGVAYADVVCGYLLQLKRCAERHAGRPLHRAVMGRPVRFVDDDDARDAAAQATLEAAARRVGFEEVVFQFEPIAAAFDHERRSTREETVLVADIGGGTSDFCIVRVGPERRRRIDRRDDLLAHHGVHVAGTDFDRHLELAAVLPAFGYRALGPTVAGRPGREVPSKVYFDLATWHLIHTVYSPQRVAELRAMRGFYADAAHHRRLMTVIDERLGHELAARAEQAKIALADVPSGAVPSPAFAIDGIAAAAEIDLELVERGLRAVLTEARCEEALRADLSRIADAADETLRRAGLAREAVDAIYFTGGSTGLGRLRHALMARFPQARAVHGERFSSVATGLGVLAARWASGDPATSRP